MVDDDQRGSVTQNHIRLQLAPDKTTDDAYLLLPKGKGPFPAVVVVFYDARTGIGLGKEFGDFAYQLAKRGFVALSLGSPPASYYPSKDNVRLMAPRPFLVSGGSEDRPERWQPLHHAIAVNQLLGCKNRVAMTNRKDHSPTKESNKQIYDFFEYFLKYGRALKK